MIPLPTTILGRTDLKVTRRLRDASKVVQIDLLDHIVMGEPSVDPRNLGYYSFHDAGMI